MPATARFQNITGLRYPAFFLITYSSRLQSVPCFSRIDQIHSGILSFFLGALRSRSWKTHPASVHAACSPCGSGSCPRNPFVFSNPRLTNYRLDRAKWVCTVCKVDLHHFTGLAFAVFAPGLMGAPEFFHKTEAIALKEVDHITIIPVVKPSCHFPTE